MTIDELITKLQKYRDKYGNLEVALWREDREPGQDEIQELLPEIWRWRYVTENHKQTRILDYEPDGTPIVML